MNPIDLCERGLVPDAILRAAVRQLSRRRLTEHDAQDPAAIDALKKEMMAQWHSGPIAVETDAAWAGQAAASAGNRVGCSCLGVFLMLQPLGHWICSNAISTGAVCWRI